MSDIVTGIKLKGDASGLVGESKRARDEMDRFKRSTGQAGREARNTSRNIDTMTVASGRLLSRLKPLAASILATFSAGALIRSLGNTARRFEVLESALETATGSAREADRVFKAIQRSASETPFSVEELTTAFIKLKNLGLEPSKAAILSYGNTASAMGKSLDQFIEAVADASVAEFERLKEFGIRAKNQGDTIAFTFKGVTTTVANESAAIESYLQRIGRTDFAGAMQRQAATLDGVLSNLGDSWANLMFAIAEAGVSNLMKDTIRTVSSGLDTITSMLSSGELLGTLSAYASAWSGWAETVEDSINIASDAVAQFPLTVIAAQALTEESLGFLGDAFKYFPQNVLAMAKAVTVELANLERLAPLYFQRFGYQVENELKKAVSIAEVYAKELADKMNPFDGDTFDLSGELAQVEAHYEARGQKVDDFFNKKINASWSARESTLQDIFDERQASISSMNEQLAAAKALATARKNATAANDNQFDQPEKIAAPALSEAQQQANFAALNKAYLSQEELLQQHAQEEMATIAKAMAEKRITEQQGLDLIYAAREQHQAKLKTLEEQRGRENGVNADGQSVFEQLRERFATQEELLQIHAQREMDIIAQAMQNKQVTEQQGLNLILAARRQHLGEVQALETQKANLIYSSAAQTFDGLASLTKTFGGEQSKAYKVLFAISKGFAISQGIMNLSTAISNAAALPWPANIPAMAQAAATGTSLIANIKGATLKGQAHEGLDKNVREGTWWLRNDEMVLNPRQRRGFENMVAANDGGQFAAGGNSRSLVFKPSISIDATNAAPGMEARINDAVLQGQIELYAKLREDFASGGELSQTMRSVA